MSLMGTTASLAVNRVTVCLTPQQREFIRLGARKYQIGFSDYLRRMLDQAMDAAKEVEAWSREARR